MRAAACGTNTSMERWAEALLLTSLAKGTVQLGMLSCLNITFSAGLQLPWFPFAVVGLVGEKRQRSKAPEIRKPLIWQWFPYSNPGCSAAPDGVTCHPYSPCRRHGSSGTLRRSAVTGSERPSDRFKARRTY